MQPSPVSELVKGPIFFNRNRVSRIHTGGKLFHDFFGDDPVDGYFPEEWMASSIKTIRINSDAETEGLSTVLGTTVTFASLLNDFPREMTGGRPFDVLVKALDSATRLPAQVHPDKKFARKHFNSEHGKTEMWMPLATRPGANLYYGFKDGVTRADLDRTIAKGENDPNAFTEILQEMPAEIGDVWLIHAGAPHAIGAGCLILEVQEPTDFTIQPDRWCGEYRLSEKDMYLGLDPEVALEGFDFSYSGKSALERGKKIPTVLEMTSAYRKEALITYEDTPCFAVTRHTVRAGSFRIHGPAVFVAIDGEGFLRHGEMRFPLKRGSYFFLPHAAGEATVGSDLHLQVIECVASNPAGRAPQHG